MTSDHPPAYKLEYPTPDCPSITDPLILIFHPHFNSFVCIIESGSKTIRVYNVIVSIIILQCTVCVSATAFTHARRHTHVYILV